MTLAEALPIVVEYERGRQGFAAIGARPYTSAEITQALDIVIAHCIEQKKVLL